jgi:hypothetical protein
MTAQLQNAFVIRSPFAVTLTKPGCARNSDCKHLPPSSQRVDEDKRSSPGSDFFDHRAPVKFRRLAYAYRLIVIRCPLSRNSFFISGDGP